MSNFLNEMARLSQKRAQELGGMSFDLQVVPISDRLELAPGNFDVIAEVKLRSPSAGELAVPGLAVEQLARAYERAGATAISVLTEPDSFYGSIDHLSRVAATVHTPVMRKDFLVDPVQVLESRAGGASGVLLISKLLTPENLIEMTDLALALGMFVLVETFDRADVEHASVIFDREVLIGVNSRDLQSLDVDVARFDELAECLPSHLPAVAESGVTTPDLAAHVARLGYSLALVGSALVGASEPSRLLESMISAGRDVTTKASV